MRDYIKVKCRNALLVCIVLVESEPSPLILLEHDLSENRFILLEIMLHISASKTGSRPRHTGRSRTGDRFHRRRVEQAIDDEAVVDNRSRTAGRGL